MIFYLYSIIMLFVNFVMLFAGPGEVTKFTVPAALVSQLSGDNKTFKGKDTADFLSDFVVVSKVANNGGKSFTMTKKGAGSVKVDCAADGKCSAVALALR